ncbi:Sorting nexin 1 [Dendrobium catenatum]|uniref:Sorting nexin 1 n=1 Tax=Dendrobium catenatum TaxID=906689 RepID=A0A2I0X9I1_9ASPA|nr:Sorting nexin 1 [Dendrobium catenatum]
MRCHGNTAREGLEEPTQKPGWRSHGKAARGKIEKAISTLHYFTGITQRENRGDTRRGRGKDSIPLNELARIIPFHINELSLAQISCEKIYQGDPVLCRYLESVNSRRVLCRHLESVNSRKTNMPEYQGQEKIVIRRYSDFVWLRDRLADKFKGIFIPPLPEKSAVDWIFLLLEQLLLLSLLFSCWAAGNSSTKRGLASLFGQSVFVPVNDLCKLWKEQEETGNG